MTVENTQRVEEFRADVASMGLSAPVDRSERTWLYIGMALFVVGVVFIGFGWYGASGEVDVAKQIPYVISGAVTGIGLIIAGSALFVRYSLGRYLRFWLVRDLYEQRAQTDRIVEALGAAPSTPAAASSPAPSAPVPPTPASPTAPATPSGPGQF